jgi:hypothetical protein
MLIEKVDNINLEALERALGDLPDPLRATIRARDGALPWGSMLKPNFVAITPCPQNVMPRSTADRMSEIISCLSAGGP